jgi:hypothetical protein
MGMHCPNCHSRVSHKWFIKYIFCDDYCRTQFIKKIQQLKIPIHFNGGKRKHQNYKKVFRKFLELKLIEILVLIVAAPALYYVPLYFGKYLQRWKFFRCVEAGCDSTFYIWFVGILMLFCIGISLRIWFGINWKIAEGKIEKEEEKIEKIKNHKNQVKGGKHGNRKRR